MKLGISYQVFDGEYFLRPAINSIRDLVHHVCVIYQTTSYFGNPAHVELEQNVVSLFNDGLIDELILYEPDLSIGFKPNELRIRNLGLQKSRDAGCTHHISADVDELYDHDQLKYAMEVMESGGYDSSLAPVDNYYKKPNWLIVPSQDYWMPLIHPVDATYDIDADFPNYIEITRRLRPSVNRYVFTRDEFVIHHMSYVRHDIRRKYLNNSNGLLFDIEKFVRVHDKYELGQRVMTIPDFCNRRTVEVTNRFNINL